jgi:hypothetical protein
MRPACQSGGDGAGAGYAAAVPIVLDPKRIHEALVDLDFPATKDEILAAAQRNAPDGEEVLKALRSLPPVDYHNLDEIIRSAPRMRTPPADPPWPRAPRAR